MAYIMAVVMQVSLVTGQSQPEDGGASGFHSFRLGITLKAVQYDGRLSGVQVFHIQRFYVSGMFGHDMLVHLDQPEMPVILADFVIA
jgi:hypothetical protein